jgi:ABC transporter substrate binding protein
MMFELEGDAFERDEEVLKGTPPADLPIERAVKFDLVVNLKSAKMLGIELPTSLLIRAFVRSPMGGGCAPDTELTICKSVEPPCCFR